MRNLIVFLCLILSVGTSISYGQDTLVLLNGDIRNGHITHYDSVSVTYDFQKRKKTNTRTLSSEIIFSIKKENSPVQIIYTQNGSFNHQLSVPDMEVYLFGIQDAKLQYKAPWAFWGGVAFNAGVGYLLYDNFWAAAGPLMYSVGIGISKIKMHPSAHRSVQITSNPFYQEGYLKIARSKKVYNALSGSLFGLIIGMSAGYATN